MLRPLHYRGTVSVKSNCARGDGRDVSEAKFYVDFMLRGCFYALLTPTEQKPKKSRGSLAAAFLIHDAKRSSHQCSAGIPTDLNSLAEEVGGEATLTIDCCAYR